MSIDQTQKSMSDNNDLPTWEEIINIPNLFEDCYTTDPKKVLGAWEKLSQSTLIEQLAAFPACVYFGLKKTYDEHFEDK